MRNHPSPFAILGKRGPVLLALLIASLGVLFSRGVEISMAQAGPSLRLPFAAGTGWRVAQGYNGGTHGPGPERYGLDLVRTDGPTAGSEVLAPMAGSIWWMNPPGAGNGCVLLKLDGGSGLIAGMCHIIARPFRTDERVSAGQVLGVIAPDGAAGNNGMAHLHFSLHRTPDYGVTRIPAPFALPDGLPLEGVSMPADGSGNQYACPGAFCKGTIVSSNGGSSSPVVSAPPSVAAFAAPAPAAVIALRPGVVASVTGGGCLNVREGPGIGARILACLPDGTSVTLAQGPVEGDGRSWWRLEGHGWAAGEFLKGLSAPAPAWSAGVAVIVDAGERDCLNLRESPGLAAAVVTCLPNGARLTVTDGPREADGHVWWQLDGGGWASSTYLRLRDGS
jgi:hypothetical protein